MRTLYMQCSSGISGDMTAAALLDLGADRQGLLAMLESVPVKGWHVEIGRRDKSGIDACDFDVVLDKHPHTHRHPADIYEIIQGTCASPEVKRLARRMFEIVAEAEAKAHGIPVEEVHFHEVGAVDSIVDILSAAYLIESLDIDRAVISPLTEGCGQVKCQHGLLPVPVPAVLNIVQAQGLELRLTEEPGEMVTPTGAAIAAALREYGKGSGAGQRPPEGRLLAVGTGSGKKDFSHANVLRAMLFEEEAEGKRQRHGEAEPCNRNSSDKGNGSFPEKEKQEGACGGSEDFLWVLETDIDDCTGEALGFVAELLMEAGARDVTMIPVYMKKNRPACRLSVLCREEERESLEDLIFLHTTTIGIRRHEVLRRALKRELLTVETSQGAVRVKKIARPSGTVWMPEYDSVREISRGNGRGFTELYQDLRREIEERMGENE